MKMIVSGKRPFGAKHYKTFGFGDIKMVERSSGNKFNIKFNIKLKTKQTLSVKLKINEKSYHRFK